jgi:hypothetical protein
LVTAGLLLGGVVLTIGSLRTAERLKAVPRMSCDELLRRGGAAPQFVTLNDVHLGERGYAFRRDMDAAMEMYVPVYSTALRQEPQGPSLVLLLQVLDDRDRDRLLAQPAVGELTVQLWTDSRRLDPWIGAQLATMYPGIQLARCRVLSVGLHEPSAGRARREFRCGMGMLGLAMASQLAWWAGRRFNESRRRIGVAPA